MSFHTKIHSWAFVRLPVIGCIDWRLSSYRPRHNLSKHILSRGGGGGTYLGQGGVLTLDLGVPTLDGGVPTLDGGPNFGYPPFWHGQGYLGGGVTYLGVPPSWHGQGYLGGGGLPTLGYPHPDMAGGGYYLGQGVLTWGYPPHPDLVDQRGGTYLGVPLLPVDRQTDACENITFPSYYVRGR